MKDSSLVRFVINIYKENKVKVCISLILVLFLTITDLYIPLLLKNIIDKGIGNKNIRILLTYVVLYLMINIMNITIDYILGYLYSIMRNKVSFNIRVKLLSHLATLSGKYYTNKKSGNILSIVQSDIDIIEGIDSKLFFDLAKNIIIAISSMYFMIVFQFDLFIAVIIAQIVLFIFQKYFTKEIHNNIKEVRKEYGLITNIISEYILNIKNIIITNSKKFFLDEFVNKERKIVSRYIKTDLLYNGNVTIAMIINSFITIFIYGYGGYKIIKGDLTLGKLIAFQSYSSMLMGPCLVIINSANKIQQARVSIDRVYSLLNEKSDIDENKEGSMLSDNINTLEFKNVSFSYNNDKCILKNINMNFKRGETNAIVGESGCGKSTIINLLYRFWDVKDGSICINNVDIRSFNLTSLREHISVVTQDSIVFDKTIRENICLDKDIDNEILLEVCKKVGIKDYVDTLEKGIDTELGESGIKISGGQKQKISIARSILQESSILILDEATSALDNISQHKIIENIKPYLEDKIVIIIAHRLSTIKDVDTIYVMSDGNIVEKGTHNELISKDSRYALLYKNENL